MVVDIGKQREPIPWAEVQRGESPAVHFFIDASRSVNQFKQDWTAVHEFSHLMVPYLHSESRWISEGLAQYYQNVLLARAGAYDALYAWQKIHAGLERGRNSRPELSPNEAASGDARAARMKVYWSGAAIALMADVALRERSGGQESLDTILERFQTCCLPSQDVWSGPEFFSKLDSLASKPVFMPLYRRYADTAGFPDVSEVFERLGLRVSDDEVSIRRKAELQAVRDAIVEASEPTAQWRGQLATN